MSIIIYLSRVSSQFSNNRPIFAMAASVDSCAQIQGLSGRSFFAALLVLRPWWPS
jgi:hypothetical protein